MPLWNLTHEKKEELIRKKEEKLQELKDLTLKTPFDLWRADLDEFLAKVRETKHSKLQLFILLHYMISYPVIMFFFVLFCLFSLLV